MRQVAEIFGIETITPELYEHALTHSSYTKELDKPYTECYERLEFLGDAVLKLSVSEVLYKMFPEAPEGNLSKIRGIVVSDNTLADIAQHNGLQDLIIMSKHEEKQGCRNLNSICACSFEAVLGAYYLDGKFSDIVKYIEKTFLPYIEDAANHFEKYNAKAVLQEYTQGINQNLPQYRVVSQSGPAHKRVFEVEAVYENKILASGKGHSKKDAEQKAAYAACIKLGIIKDA